MIELAVYIAGPLYSSGDIVTNNRNAIDAAAALERAPLDGVKLRPFVPHVHVLTWQLVHPRTHEEGQTWDDFWLAKCDALLRLPGYSVGTDHEGWLAHALMIPVFTTVVQVIDWARQMQSCEG